jgi:hypothetical protein
LSEKPPGLTGHHDVRVIRVPLFQATQETTPFPDNWKPFSAWQQGSYVYFACRKWVRS